MAKPATTPTAFISYAREDAAFAHQLDTSLTARGIRVLIDRSAIAPAEVFEARLDAMILEADAVVFVMSEAALSSRYCQWEVARADELQKRIVPVVWRNFDDGGYRPPEGLRRRNWIFADGFQRLGPGATTDSPHFAEPFEKIVTAITIDIDWQREHTHHIARAQKWDVAKRPAGEFLLSGVEMNAAQSWANRKPDAESIPDLFFGHLDASLAKAARDLEALNERERRISTRTQQLVAREALRALDAGLHSRSMRLSLAGEPSPDELSRGVKPESALRSVLAAAAQSSPCILALPHPRGVNQALLTLTGSQAVTASHDNIARVWDMATGAVVREVRHDGLITAVALAEQAGLIATASRDHTVRLWRFDGTSEVVSLTHADEVTSLAFSPDSNWLVIGGFDSWAIVWDVVTNRDIARLKHIEDVHSVAFSSDGRFLATAESGGVARMWSTVDWSELHRLPHSGRVYRACFSPDGRRIGTASEDGTAAIWDAATGQRLFALQHRYPVNQITFSPDDNVIATASMDRSARLWDAATGAQLHHFSHGGEVIDVAFSADCRWLATASDDRTASIWDVATGDALLLFRHDDTVTRVSFASDGKTLLTSSLDGSARAWRATPTDGVAAVPAVRADDFVVEPVDSPDGTMAIGDWPDLETDVARVVRSHNGARMYDLRHDGHARINSVAFSADSRLIATGADDKTARIWIAATGAEFVRIPHDVPVKQVLFSPDGRALLTVTKVFEFGGEDVARIFDADTGVLLYRIPRGDVRAAKFANDGRSVITLCMDGMARTWDASLVLASRDEALVRFAAEHRLRGEPGLTDAELLILRPLLGLEVHRDVVARWRPHE